MCIRDRTARERHRDRENEKEKEREKKKNQFSFPFFSFSHFGITTCSGFFSFKKISDSFFLFFFFLFYRGSKRDSSLSPSSSQKILLPSLRDKKDKLLLLRLLPCVAVPCVRAESDHSLLFRFFSLTYSLYLRLNDIAYKSTNPGVVQERQERQIICIRNLVYRLISKYTYAVSYTHLDVYKRQEYIYTDITTSLSRHCVL